MANNNATRPEELNNVSETQIEELQRQFDEGDKEAWAALTGSYGWSESRSKAVWEWFAIDPTED